MPGPGRSSSSSPSSRGWGAPAGWPDPPALEVGGFRRKLGAKSSLSERNPPASGPRLRSGRMAPSGQLSDGCRSLQCPRGDGRVQRIDCGREERKHLIAEEYLREYAVGLGVFLILIARAPAP